jgi:hypothetical protein
MRGIPEFNFPAFRQAAALLRKEGHVVFNPAERDTQLYGEAFSKTNPTGCEKLAAAQHGFSLREALASDIKWICLHGDAIALLPGWEKSKGALAEKALGEALGLEIRYL